MSAAICHYKECAIVSFIKHVTQHYCAAWSSVGLPATLLSDFFNWRSRLHDPKIMVHQQDLYRHHTTQGAEMGCNVGRLCQRLATEIRGDVASLVYKAAAGTWGLLDVSQILERNKIGTIYSHVLFCGVSIR